METYICQKCNKLFLNEGPTSCTFCDHPYVVWVTYPQRSKKEVEELLKTASV